MTQIGTRLMWAWFAKGTAVAILGAMSLIYVALSGLIRAFFNPGLTPLG